MEAGKHTITTKPMEVTPERCDTMIAAQQKTGKLLGVDFQERYVESNQFVKFAMDEGLLGKAILGEARLKWYRSQSYYDAGGWRGTWRMDGGGALTNQSVHWVDLLQWIMGDVNRLWAKTGTFTHEIETEDFGSAMLEFKSGAMGGILGTTTFPGDPFAGLEIHGSEGGFISTRAEPEWYFLDGMEDRKQKLERLTPANNAVEDFVSAVRDGTPLLCGAVEGRKSMALLAAVYESGRRDGAPVPVH
jgi:predicted dehydrogenase